ncbi:MAG TPA: hypothetical protein VHB79_16505 [Polyangiaceae bacterium]|nr:hypothetical protein [Polyangiaceae bacterium]
MKGRSAELRTLSQTITAAAAVSMPRGFGPATRLALVGSGGSGKSMLAAALGHRLKSFFGGRIDWFRVGAWDFPTLTEVLALRFGTPRGEDSSERAQALRDFFVQTGPRLIVLDNHEDDRATARLLDAFRDSPVTFVVTARRCLLAGVLVYPVTAPLATVGQSAFPRVKALTRLLRFSPLALDIADSLVASRAISVKALGQFLEERGVSRVVAVEHEDDLPEVALLVDWAWQRLSPESRRMWIVLSHVEGDHMDAVSLGKLAAVRGDPRPALAPLERWHLVQEPVQGRYTLHAVVRHTVRRRKAFDPARFYRHYVALLERHPERLELEQTHLFAAMDHAHRTGDLGAMLRVEALLRSIEA